jgi:hypothetical protein
MEVRYRMSVFIDRGQVMLVWVDGGQERDGMLVWVRRNKQNVDVQ